MSKHYKSEYYQRASDGAHVMSYEVFQALTLERIWKILHEKKKK